MRLYASRLHALLALVLTIGAHDATASTCKTLLDSSSTLAKSLESWTEADLSPIDFSTVFKEIDTALPWLSKCAAAIDPKAVYTSLASSSTVKSCLTTLENFDDDLGTSEGWSSVCLMIENTTMPCVQSALTDSIMDAFNSAGGCCDDFLDEVKTLFGDSFDDLVIKLLQLGANVECSERTYTNLKGVVTKEMCGYSIVHSFTFIDEDTDTNTLLNLAQIPNDQMCNAFEGKAFTNTKGASTTIGFGTNDVDTMGICLEPIDTLMQYLKSSKLFSEKLDADGTSVSLSNLFTSGKSIRGSLLLSYATTSTNLPMMGLRATDKVIKALGGFDEEDSSDTFLEDSFVEMIGSINSYAASLLIHMPNNGDCSYSGQSITLPYAETAASTEAGTSSASSTQLSGVMTTGLVLLSTVLMGAIL
ncbi:unnamed protein product [Phytophthora lilii]|uniref:Unnamed protein product n=1 Tax=Phytophthora lilii TaxID=2077276 RepID=A0A9W6U2U5_9STRA|nr:unnamed protein product [Phytophthora lilii]